jgi:hypothetical protein
VQWELLRPEAERVMTELRQATGRPMVHELRAVLDAVFYVVRNGIEWCFAGGFPAVGCGVCVLSAVEPAGYAPRASRSAAGAGPLEDQLGEVPEHVLELPVAAVHQLGPGLQ